MYKLIISLPDSQIGPHLNNACDDTEQNSLVVSYPTFSDVDESDMLKILEKIGMKGVNPAGDQMSFGNLMQSDGESLKDFHRDNVFPCCSLCFPLVVKHAIQIYPASTHQRSVYKWPTQGDSNSTSLPRPLS